MPRAQRELVRPLLTQWYEGADWRWRAFLPLSLRPYLSAEYAVGGRAQQWAFHWNDDDLLKMIEDRMLHHSKNRYMTIGELCEEELRSSIDAELVALSKGNPRNAILLASNLFREHCSQRVKPLPRLIGRATWETVRSKWEQGAGESAKVAEKPPAPQPAAPRRPAEPIPSRLEVGETDSHPVPAPAPGVLRIDEAGAVWVGALEITRKLSKHRYSVLKLLYDHAGKVVTKEQIIDAGWPLPEYKNPLEVSDDMIRQRINHIRDILSAEIEYIESVPGRGYRLHSGGKGLRRARTVLPST
jgi:hypothetical protein